jgi:biopolymer transport protein ExbD/biopolymer transport protein TolR
MARKRMRKFSVKVSAPMNSEINVTPLVDVVLVLLIIFMVVTPLLEKDIEVRVPDADDIQETTEVPPDQLVVSLDAEGALKINADAIALPEYIEKLKRMVAAKPRGERLVFFMADDRTNYGKLVWALDGARLAGAETLGMMTEKLDQPLPLPPAPPEPPAAP